MKNLFAMNPEVEAADIKALWFGSPKIQELYMMLVNLGVTIDAFCMEEVKYETFLCKKALSIFELINSGENYALILAAEDYEAVLKKYESYGLQRDKLFVWKDSRRELIYV